MNVIPLASSSKGNAYAVAYGGMVLLVDCGLSCRRLRELCAGKGVDLNSVAAVLITHDHSDHVSGLKVFLNRYDVPVYANVTTAEKLIRDYGLADDAFVCFENGQSFEIGPVKVTPFSTPHDAVDSVGYLIETERGVYFHGTDIGTPLESIGAKIALADVVTIESNHDPVLLSQSQRAESLKRRISGPRGHLSNDDAAKLVRRFASQRLKRVYLAHLSDECNAPHIAERTMRETLVEIGRGDVELTVI